MVKVTRDLADRIAEAARLLDDDNDADAVLGRLTRLGAELVPGGKAAALTVEGAGQAMTFAASDSRIDELHRLQFAAADGPAVEALRYNEPRRIDDMTAEDRWPVFCRAAARAGFGSCLMLPLRTDCRPAGAVSFYGHDSNVFRGASHDLAVLFAAQGGTAVHNAAVYRASQLMVMNLHTALGSRAVIEQAKGILHAELGVSLEEAFGLLSRMSQNTNRKLRVIASALVRGEITSGQLRPRLAPAGIARTFSGSASLRAARQGN